MRNWHCIDLPIYSTPDDTSFHTRKAEHEISITWEEQIYNNDKKQTLQGYPGDLLKRAKGYIDNSDNIDNGDNIDSEDNIDINDKWTF
jgi:hypothetical protein